MTEKSRFSEKCQKYLQERWYYILENEDKFADIEPLPEEFDALKQNIKHCLTSKTKSYRYVLPTQLLAKAATHTLDCHSLQAAFAGKGAFDARTIAHKVIVPFDKANHNVLGGSNEPYVNNPLRCTAVSKENRARQKNKEDWDRLVLVLDRVEKKNNSAFTKSVFDQVLLEIYRLLADVAVVYAVPSRASLENAIQLIQTFVAGRSGGDRLEVVATALFKAVSKRFDLFDEIKREKVNAPDSMTGMVADIECWLKGQIVLLVEIKDRELNLTQLDAKLEIARANKIKEILFLAQEGLESNNAEEIHKRITHEFASGQNVYVANLIEFAKGILILLGEQGRVELISSIGDELEASQSSIRDRKAWAALLRTM